MNELLNYIKSLSDEGKEAFAIQLRTTVGYLRKAISAKESLNPKTCVRIEKATRGKITRQMLREDFAEIWPELVKGKTK